MKEKWEALRKKYWPPGKDQFLIMALCGLLLAVIAVPVDSGKEKGTQENNGQETETPQETDSYEEQMEKWRASDRSGLCLPLKEAGSGK